MSNFASRYQKNLWDGFRKGDQQCLSEIFLSNYDELFKYAFHILGNEEQTKDSIQELFYKIWKNRANLGDCNSIKYYLIKSLRSLILDLRRSQKKQIEHAGDNILDFDFPFEHWLILSQEEEVTRTRIENALKSLSIRQREAIYLRFYEEYDFPKIAELMSVNVQSVRNLIQVALQILKKTFVTFLFVCLTSFYR